MTTNMLIFSFVTVILNGIHMPTQTIYLLVSLLLVGVALLIVDPLLQFLTIKNNAITQLLVITLISVAILYTLEIFMPQFAINGFVVKPQTFEMLDINQFTMGTIGTMIFYGLVTGLISIFVKSLK